MESAETAKFEYSLACLGPPQLSQELLLICSLPLQESNSLIVFSLEGEREGGSWSAVSEYKCSSTS